MLCVVGGLCGVYMGFEEEMCVVSFVGGAYAIMNTHTQRTEELSDISFTFCLIPMIKCVSLNLDLCCGTMVL